MRRIYSVDYDIDAITRKGKEISFSFYIDSIIPRSVSRISVSDSIIPDWSLSLDMVGEGERFCSYKINNNTEVLLCNRGLKENFGMIPKTIYVKFLN